MKGRRAACDAAPHDDDLGLDHGASDAGYPAMHVTSPPARLALDMTARDTYGAPYSSGGGRSMIPAAFEYHAPTSIIEASALLARVGEDAKILSGGQSLIPLMKLRLAHPPHRPDINGIPGLSFFPGPFATALKADEILTGIRVPVPTARSAGAYLKVERKVGDFATAAVAVQITLAANDLCSRIGIGLTNVGLTPIKAGKAEGALRGQRLDDKAIKEAARLAADAAQPAADLRGPVEYKKDLVRVLTVRALHRALERVAHAR